MLVLSLDQDHIPFWTEKQQRKGIGREKSPCGISWASPRIPDMSGMTTGRVRYERDYKNRITPLAQTSLSPSKQPADALLPNLGQPRISPRKRERGRLHWRRLGSRIEGPWIWISHRSLFSPLKVP